MPRSAFRAALPLCALFTLAQLCVRHDSRTAWRAPLDHSHDPSGPSVAGEILRSGNRPELALWHCTAHHAIHLCAGLPYRSAAGSAVTESARGAKLRFRASSHRASGHRLLWVQDTCGHLACCIARPLLSHGSDLEQQGVYRRQFCDGSCGAGREVHAWSCDVSDGSKIAAMAAKARAELSDKPLGTVVHAAGVIDHVDMMALTEDGMASVFKPKVAGAWHLHEKTKEDPRHAGVSGKSANAGRCSALRRATLDAGATQT